MKIAITGHTSGIGKSLYNKFVNNRHSVVGFSRTNGFDITDSTSRDRIIELSDDVDVFINNAWAPKCQTELLTQLIRHNQNRSKIIVNISSLAGLIEKNTFNVPDQYILDKKTQNSICTESILDSRNPKILNVITGFVDTPMVKNYTTPKLSPDQLAEFLIYIIEHDQFFLHQIIVNVK